ncbi:VTT domain-containing protein [Haloferacaceae archaeon DSL9]
MLEWIATTSTAFVDTYGLLALFVVFVLEGALVGKVIPTRTLCIATIVLLGGTLVGSLSVFAVAVAGATIGQCLLFLAIRHGETDESALVRRVRLDERAFARLKRWIDNWGLPALVVSNTLPGVRGYAVVPVALSRTPGSLFSICSLFGTIIYVGALVLIALSLDELADSVAVGLLG